MGILGRELPTVDCRGRCWKTKILDKGGERGSVGDPFVEGKRPRFMKRKDVNKGD